MNIYSKLQKMRVELQGMSIKKSGENKFAGYKYYELGDILPPINQLMLDNGVAGLVTFEAEAAKLRLVNCEKPEEVIEFASPMATATLKGAHDIQNLGAVETYQRRYLYMVAFEVAESDFFDATQGKDQPKGQPNKPAQKAEQKKMSDDMAAKLNAEVMTYAKLAGKTAKAVMVDVQREIGKAPAQMDDDDGAKVLELLSTMTNRITKDNEEDNNGVF